MYFFSNTHVNVYHVYTNMDIILLDMHIRLYIKHIYLIHILYMYIRQVS